MHSCFRAIGQNQFNIYKKDKQTLLNSLLMKKEGIQIMRMLSDRHQNHSHKICIYFNIRYIQMLILLAKLLWIYFVLVGHLWGWDSDETHKREIHRHISDDSFKRTPNSLPNMSHNNNWPYTHSIISLLQCLNIQK